MPAAGIVEGFVKRQLAPMEEEGGFMLDPSQIAGVEPLNQVQAKRGKIILVRPDS
jgi:hypothetical protein